MYDSKETGTAGFSNHIVVQTPPSTSPLFSDRHKSFSASQAGKSPSFWLGLFGLVVTVALMAMSLILDYEAKTNRLVFVLNGVGYSFALFTEIVFTTLLVYLVLKGADRRLMWLACFIIMGMFICGVVIFYG